MWHACIHSSSLSLVTPAVDYESLSTWNLFLDRDILSASITLLFDDNNCYVAWQPRCTGTCVSSASSHMRSLPSTVATPTLSHDCAGLSAVGAQRQGTWRLCIRCACLIDKRVGDVILWSRRRKLVLPSCTLRLFRSYSRLVMQCDAILASLGLDGAFPQSLSALRLPEAVSVQLGAGDFSLIAIGHIFG